MKRSKTRGRAIVLATYLVAGAFLLQLGPCMGMALNMGVTSFDFSVLLDENELLFGLFAPCGQPHVRYVNEDGTLAREEGLGDERIWDCPVTVTVIGPDG